jgi:hypothetical protein
MKVSDMTPEQHKRALEMAKRYRETHKEQAKEYYDNNYRHDWSKKKEVDGEVIEDKYFRLFGSPVDIHVL